MTEEKLPEKIAVRQTMRYLWNRINELQKILESVRHEILDLVRLYGLMEKEDFKLPEETNTKCEACKE